jgi:hypothetical protein
MRPSADDTGGGGGGGGGVHAYIENDSIWERICALWRWAPVRCTIINDHHQFFRFLAYRPETHNCRHLLVVVVVFETCHC